MYNNISLKTPVLIFDFEKQAFNGDSYQAHQFIPSLSGNVGVPILLLLQCPAISRPQITEHDVLKKQEHASDQALAAVESKKAIKYVHLPDARESELSHTRRTVADPQECAQHMNGWILSAILKFCVVTTLGSTSHNVTKTRELMRKYDIAPDQLFISPSHFRHRPN